MRMAVGRLHHRVRRVRGALVAATMLSVPVAWAETVDHTVTIDASAQLAQLTSNASLVPVENRNAVAVASADLNRDGHADVLVWHRLPEEPPFLLLNDGHGQFRDEGTARLPALREGQTLTAALADLDGDGDMDAYVGRLPSDQVWINDGFGVFTDETSEWLTAETSNHAIAIGDVTADQRPDVVGVQSGTVRVFENRGVA